MSGPPQSMRVVVRLNLRLSCSASLVLSAERLGRAQMMAPYFKKPEKDKKVLGMLQGCLLPPEPRSDRM